MIPDIKKNFWKKFYKNPVYGSPIIITWVYLSYMKIIITEEQLTMVDWFLENQEKLDIIFYNIISSENFYGNYVMFRPLDKTIDSVINILYEEWSYMKMNFSGESGIKEYLRNHSQRKLKINIERQREDTLTIIYKNKIPTIL